MKTGLGIKFNKTASFCKVSFDNCQNWVHGILTQLDTEKYTAQVYLPVGYLNYYFKKNEKVVIKTLSNTNELLFTGIIEKKYISIRKQSIVVQVNDLKLFPENRKYTRFNASCTSLIKTPDGNSSLGVLHEISLCGAKVYLKNDDLDENDTLDIEVSISPGRILSLKTTIVRKNKAVYNRTNCYSYALLISEIDEENCKLLSDFIDFLVIQNEKESEKHFSDYMRYSVYPVYGVVIIFLIVFIFKLFM